VSKGELVEDIVEQPAAKQCTATSRPETLPLSKTLNDDMKLSRLSSNVSVVCIADHVERLTHTTLGNKNIFHKYTATPVFKEENNLEIGNNRPINLTNVCCKITQAVVRMT
jgi:hypothetical protein